MKSDKKTNKPNKNADNKSQPQPTKTNTDNRMNTTTNQNNSDDRENQIRKVTYWQKNREKWFDPLVIVTILLAGATFALFLEAAKEGEAAKISANAAKEAADATKGLLEETKKEFNVSSSPLLQVYQLAVSNFGIGRRFTISYNINNISNYPATIKTIKSSILISAQTSFDSLTVFPISETDTTNVLAEPNGAPIVINDNYPTNLSEEQFNQIKDQKAAIYLYSEIKYETTLDTRKFVYQFAFQIKPFAAVKTISIFRSNKEVF